MIISNYTVLLKRILELRHALLSQNYPRQVISNGIERALNLNRTELITSDEHIVAFVSIQKIQNYSIIKQNLDKLFEDEIMRNILSNYDKIKNKRQPPSLKKLLSKARFRNNSQQAKISQCGRPSCGLCQHLILDNTFHFKSCKTYHVAPDIMQCKEFDLCYSMYGMPRGIYW